MDTPAPQEPERRHIRRFVIPDDPHAYERALHNLSVEAQKEARARRRAEKKAGQEQKR